MSKKAFNLVPVCLAFTVSTLLFNACTTIVDPDPGAAVIILDELPVELDSTTDSIEVYADYGTGQVLLYAGTDFEGPFQQSVTDYNGNDVTYTVIQYDADGNVVTEGSIIFDVDGGEVDTVFRLTLSLDSTTLDLSAGTYTLVASLTPNVESEALGYTSSDKAIATVNDNGQVSLLQAGNVEISVYLISKDTVRAVVHIIITDTTTVDTSGTDTTDIKPESIEITTVDFEIFNTDLPKQVEARILPDSATQEIIWHLSDSTLASINKNGLLSPLNMGTVTVTARAAEDVTLSDSIRVTVKEQVVDSGVDPGSIEITTPAFSMLISEPEQTITARVLPVNAPQLYSWSLSDSSLGTISSTGMFAATAPGQVLVIVTSTEDPSLKDSLQITLEVPAPDSVVITEDALPLYLGLNTGTLTAQIYPEDFEATVLWSSADPDIASVDATGVVTAVAAGETAIMATVQGFPAIEDEVLVTVVKDAPVIDAGNTVSDVQNATIAFTIVMTQAVGEFTSLNYDFEGDDTWDSTTTEFENHDSIQISASHLYADTGTYTARFEATDSEGNVTLATRTVIIVAPGVITILIPENDTIVNATPFEVTYSVDGEEFQKSFNLVEGSNTLTLDSNNTTGLVAASVEVTLDTQKPNAPEITTTVTVTNDGTPTLEWESGGGGGNGVFDYSITGPGNYETTGSESVTEFTPAANLQDGEYTLSVRERDQAGNLSSASTHSLTVDRTDPVVNISSPSAGNSTTNSYTFNGSATDVNGVVLITYAITGATSDAGTFYNGEASTNQAWSKTGGLTLAEGSSTLTVTATDEAGNTNQATVVVNQNVPLPVVTITEPVDDYLINQNSITLKWQVDGGSLQEETVGLVEGENVISRSSENSVGEEGNDTIKVYYQNALFVRPIGVGSQDGSNWSNAMQNLEYALNTAEGNGKGQSVWFGGLYYEADSVIGYFENMHLYGGFIGNERTLAERDIDDPDKKTQLETKQSHIFRAFISQTNNVIDGFKFTQNDIIVSSGFAQVTFRNCDFQYMRNETAYLFSTSADNSRFVNCSFRNNEAEVIIQIQAQNTRFDSCIIENNTTTYIGGSVITLFGTNRSVIIRNGYINGNIGADTGGDNGATHAISDFYDSNSSSIIDVGDTQIQKGKNGIQIVGGSTLLYDGQGNTALP